MFKYIATIISIGLMLIAPEALAQQAFGVDTVFTNYKTIHDGLMDLLGKGAYLIGLFFTVFGIFKLKEMNETKKFGLNVPMSYIGTGTFILCIASSVDIMATTIYGAQGGASFLMPQVQGAGAQFKNAIEGVLLFVKLIGFVAFIRGWLFLQKAGLGKEGMIGRGLTHIFGGVMAMNAYATLKILQATFGFPLPI